MLQSFDEGDLIADILRDEAFGRRLFGDLNHDILGPPGDDKIIILGDSDEEEEVHEEKVTDTEAVPSSTARSPALTASVDDAPAWVKNDNSDDLTSNQEVNGSNDSEDDTGLP
jgi:hypothetical protein